MDKKLLFLEISCISFWS